MRFSNHFGVKNLKPGETAETEGPNAPAPTTREMTVTFTILDDDIAELGETIIVFLNAPKRANPTNDNTLKVQNDPDSDNVITITIKDDDGVPPDPPRTSGPPGATARSLCSGATPGTATSTDTNTASTTVAPGATGRRGRPSRQPETVTA